MIQVSFFLFNVLADAVGARQIPKSFPEGTPLLQAVQVLAAEYPPAFQTLLLPDGAISNYLKVFVNGRLVGAADFLKQLQDGDAIMLFPAVSGG